MADPAIETEALTKFYGRARGIEDVTFAVPAGSVFGFLGPNGAGKTTTIRLLMDFIRPTRGRVRVLGRDARTDSVEIKRRVGFIPGELAMYGKMTGAELLRYFGYLRGGVDPTRATDLAARLELDLTRRVAQYSSGNKQKLAIVQAFMHRPELLVLDEPTNGLDPLIQQSFYGIVEDAMAGGATVFLSSHILPEVERIADRVAIIRAGRLVVVDDVDELKARAVRRLEIFFAAAPPLDEFRRIPAVRTVEARDHGTVLHLAVEGPIDEVVKLAARFEVHNIVSDEGDLEGVFLGYYTESADAG